MITIELTENEALTLLDLINDKDHYIYGAVDRQVKEQMVFLTKEILECVIKMPIGSTLVIGDKKIYRPSTHYRIGDRIYSLAELKNTLTNSP